VTVPVQPDLVEAAEEVLRAWLLSRGNMRELNATDREVLRIVLTEVLPLLTPADVPAWEESLDVARAEGFERGRRSQAAVLLAIDDAEREHRVRPGSCPVMVEVAQCNHPEPHADHDWSWKDEWVWCPGSSEYLSCPPASRWQRLRAHLRRKANR
jgi:hypothetical protein